MSHRWFCCVGCGLTMGLSLLILVFLIGMIVCYFDEKSDKKKEIVREPPPESPEPPESPPREVVVPRFRPTMYRNLRDQTC